MTFSNGLQMLGELFARWFFKCLPLLHLRWQNQSLFTTPLARGMRALGLCAASVGGVLVVWQSLCLAWALPVPSVQWTQIQKHALAVASQHAAQQRQAQSSQIQLEQLRRASIDHQTQIDELVLAWPNANLRMSMLSRLQSMAQLRGLQTLQMKALPDAAQQGYEATQLKFSVRGTEWAAHAYWQALNQLFQNGLWLSWSCRLLPDGQYSFEGHMTLLWDAQDAFTDTGLELQSMAAQPTEKPAPHVNSAVHVLPDQSQSQMRVVGAARVAQPGDNSTAWTWIRHGSHIQLVQPGQRLGLEQSQAGYSDDQGLWLKSGRGMPDTQLSWEGGKP